MHIYMCVYVNICIYIYMYTSVNKLKLMPVCVPPVQVS